MTVYILIREDQNEHGYIDTSIVGVYTCESKADEAKVVESMRARADGLVVENDESPDGEWQVSWMIRAHDIDMSPEHPSPL